MNTNIHKCNLIDAQVTKGIQKVTKKVFKKLQIHKKRYSKSYTNSTQSTDLQLFAGFGNTCL